MLSFHAYHCAVKLNAQDHPFHALVAAAMMRADTKNEALLRWAFPEVWDTLRVRHNAPLGVVPDLDGEIDMEVLRKKLRDM